MSIFKDFKDFDENSYIFAVVDGDNILNYVVFKKEEAILSFGLKELLLESPVSGSSSFFKEMRTLVDTLYIDTPTALHVKLSTAEEMVKKAIEQEKKLDATTVIDTLMSWQIQYEPDTKRVHFAIVLP